jgi:tetratricopeptide (TPR) repeat protein
VQNEDDARRLIRYFGELDARFYIGRAAVAAGAGGLAVPNLQYVCRILPDYRRAHLYLAAALGMAGHAEEGVAEYRTAMRLSGDPVMLEAESVALFASLAQQKPQEALAVYSYGVVLRQFGRYREALEVQKKAFAVQPSPSIQSEIQDLEKALAGLHEPNGS